MANLLFDESASNSDASQGYAWWFSGDTFEKAAAEERKPIRRSLSYRINSHPGRLTIIYFVVLVCLSTSLLLLPISTQEGQSTSFSTAFFTAVSALSTCGISIVNTTSHWSMFGQAVLIISVQMGGLGVMTFASLIALAVNHHLKAMQRLLTASELGTNKLSEIRGVLTVVLTTTFVIESITFIALFPGLLHVNKGSVGHSLWESLFFAVMAYNNAGFTPDGAGLYVNNWAVGMPIMLSAFCGTLGFPSSSTSSVVHAATSRPNAGTCTPRSPSSPRSRSCLSRSSGSWLWNGTIRRCSNTPTWRRACAAPWWPR